MASSDATPSTEDGNTTEGFSTALMAERELRLRYHHQIYAALEKHVRNEQQHQMKLLAVSTTFTGYL